jgi:uncharacterized protein YlxP (DUF503 family)
LNLQETIRAKYDSQVSVAEKNLEQAQIALATITSSRQAEEEEVEETLRQLEEQKARAAKAAVAAKASDGAARSPAL